MPSDFVELVRRGKAIAGSQRALARTLGVTEQTISRVMKGRDYPFNELNCVRLARLIKEPDWVVLRAANKRAMADLLEHAYGDRPVRITPPSRRDALDGLPAAVRRHLLSIIRVLRKKASS